jgi:hypothetical protein
LPPEAPLELIGPVPALLGLMKSLHPHRPPTLTEIKKMMPTHPLQFSPGVKGWKSAATVQ